MVNRFLLLFIASFFLINLFSIIFVGPYAWDDGAITLAYAKSIAEYGRFSLTSVSEIVEGSSSILFVLLNALAFKIANFSFDGFIRFSQILSFFFSILIIFFLYLNLKNRIDNWRYCLIISFSVIGLPMITSEIQNGMEMTMFSALLILFVYCFENKSKWTYLVIPLLLLARFESIYYLLFALSGLWVFNKEDKHKAYLLRYLLFVVTVFSFVTLIRYIYFNDFLPNTIYAKMNPPYTPVDFKSKLIFKFSGLTEFLYVYSGFLLTLCVIFFLNKSISININSFFVLAFLSFSLLSGKNWGYDGRMALACLPVFVLMLFDVNPEYTQLSFLIRDKTKYSYTKNQCLFVVLVASILTSYIINIPLYVTNLQKIVKGGFYQKLLPHIFDEYINNIISKRNLINDYGISPENYRITGIAVDKLRQILGLDVIKFMTPDVGGVGLCCTKISVLDLGLLTNRYLAKNGYSKLDILLQSVVPDVIETEDTWSTVSEIYKSNYFNENYIPIVFNKNLLWINKSHYQHLSEMKLVNIRLLNKLDELKNIRYARHSVDTDFIFNKKNTNVSFVEYED
jgi:hypothetical protein